MNHKTTLKDIAEKAKVSIALASVVLNGKKGRIMASPENTKRILEVAAELNFTPNANARGLRMDKSFMIGILS
jgi:LacI family transcriptional regulator